MRAITFSELRNQAKKYFDAVENGETMEVYRHGKPIAILMPARKRPMDRWKKYRPMKLSASLSHAILADRSEGR